MLARRLYLTASLVWSHVIGQRWSERLLATLFHPELLKKGGIQRGQWGIIRVQRRGRRATVCVIGFVLMTPYSLYTHTHTHLSIHTHTIFDILGDRVRNGRGKEVQLLISTSSVAVQTPHLLFRKHIGMIKFDKWSVMPSVRGQMPLQKQYCFN